jgi:hypothetical protein
MKTSSQQLSSSGNSSLEQKTLRFTAIQRIVAAAILPAELGGLAILNFLNSHGFVFYPFPCGFKARFGLPCPTCGMTTSVLALAHGDILYSFYIQPAAAAFCSILILVGIVGLLMAVCGTDWGLVRQIRFKYIIMTFLVLLVGGWAVTLARAFAKF